MKNIRKQAPKGMTHYNTKTDTYNNTGDGFSLARLSAKAEVLICIALMFALLFSAGMFA